jgi:hypothetical protein
MKFRVRGCNFYYLLLSIETTIMFASFELCF